jgi:hypothetical protein
MAPRFIYRRTGRKNVDYKKFQMKLEEKEELNEPNTEGSNKYVEITNTIQYYLKEYHPYKKIDTQRILHKTKPICVDNRVQQNNSRTKTSIPQIYTEYISRKIYRIQKDPIAN